jgi:ABC-type proline/glycine betaine transport system permease subunit
MRFAFLYLLPRVVLARIGYSLKVPGVFAVNICSFTFFFRARDLKLTRSFLRIRGQIRVCPLH